MQRSDTTLDNASKIAAVRTKTAEVIAKAKSLYGVDLSSALISFDLRGRVAGWALWKHCGIGGTKQYQLKFNQDMILGNHLQDMLNDIVPHEVAHLVCYANPILGRKHDTGWKRICIALGGNGRRCHNNEVQYVNGGYDYMTDTGRKVTVSTILHRKIQEGRTYRFRDGKGHVTQDSAYCTQGGVMPASKPVQVTVPAYSPPSVRYPWQIQVTVVKPVIPAQAGGMSKAAQVRDWIRDAKNHGETQESVIAQTMYCLSMPRGQAIRYVTENWVRV